MTFSTHELAWASGFFDGEGHAGFQQRARNIRVSGRRTYSTIILDVRQVDRRVLDRFRAAVMNVGHLYGPYRNSGASTKARPYFVFAAASFEHVQAVVAMLWRWLSPVKREQVRAMLVSRKNTPRTKCGRKLIQRAKGTTFTVLDLLAFDPKVAPAEAPKEI